MSGSLTTEERELLEELFDRAVDLPHAEHEVFIERECPAPGALRKALVGLLKGLTGPDALHQLQHGEPSRTGERIGPYVLRERIGGGGMGEVYAADQVSVVERRVAIKFIRLGMDSAQFVARFEAERQALARMAHTHVAQVFDAGATSDGRPYFVMELVEGEPITEYCDTHRLSTRERLELFLGVCEGVEHAHQKGLIHRDLKPSNILVAEQDGRGVPKIIDFGVVRATTGRLGDESLLTMAGQVVGTLDYMSPEQADPSDATTDTRSDVYSLGVVLYQLLTGLLPIERISTAPGNLAEIQRAIREDDPPTPSRRFRREAAAQAERAPLHGTNQRSLIRQLSGDLDWITLKSLEKNPARRYQSASDLAADIRRHLEHLPVQARRPGGLYRTGKFVRRHRVGAATSTIVVSALLIGIAGVVSGQAKAATRGKQLARLSDGARLERLYAQADALWPLEPNVTSVEELERWLDSARDLFSRLDGHRRTMSDLERQASDDSGAAGSGDLDGVGFEREWQIQEISTLVAGIEALESNLFEVDGLTLDHGWSIPRRIAVSREREVEFAEGGVYHRAWLDALPKILAQRADLDGDGVEELVYPGLELEIQMGLVPLGPDPDSKLWEFAHLASGAVARRVDGRLVMVPEMGVVLVLVPGGTFDMGSQNADADGGNYVDPGDLGPYEGPVHSVKVDPFFLSKFEMTQTQWARISGGISPFARKPPGLTEDEAAMLPIQSVTWTRCEVITSRLGLCFPTEEQWEYAARGGSDRARWTDSDFASMEQCENILDQSKPGGLLLPGSAGTIAPFSNGFKGLAPVGSFFANPFGLHDVLGNVTEWTGSHPWAYEEDLAPPPRLDQIYVARGGNFRCGPEIARAASRAFSNVKDFYIFTVGLRPARAIARAQ